jgi:hypothetical protein
MSKENFNKTLNLQKRAQINRKLKKGKTEERGAQSNLNRAREADLYMIKDYRDFALRKEIK